MAKTLPGDDKSDKQVTVFGRFMRSSWRDYPCRVTYIDEMTLVINALTELDLGEYLVCYLDGYGRVAGKVVDKKDLYFTIDIDATPHKRQKIADTSSSLRLGKRITEMPRFSRMRTSVKEANLTLEDGSVVLCEVRDMSMGGAMLRTYTFPKIGSKVRLGKLEGTVIRHSHDGIALQFDTDAELNGFEDFFDG